MSADLSLADYFVASARRFPRRPALNAAGCEFSYTELGAMAAAVARTLKEAGAGPRIGVLADRSIATYAGVLGILLSGRAYVALNPKFPAERNQSIVRHAGLTEIVCDQREAGGGSLTWVNETTGVTLLTVAPATPEEPATDAGSGGHVVVVTDRSAVPAAARVDAGDIAYLMFTSGTTGTPKGVPITHGNARTYVENILAIADVHERDRFSQTFDLTFDLSVHDMFVAWAVGACVCVVPERAVMAPARFIREQGITIWFSVPSTIGFMHKLRTLKAGAFPTLRCSWFCGEALSAEAARLWQQAAPGSYIENLYGPTEATIAFTVYRWRGDESDADLPGGLVPIGRPMGDLETLVIDADRRPVGSAETGELCLGGAQLSPGYWNDRDKTDAVFIDLAVPGRSCSRWYRTGDLARVTGDGVLQFVGRLDSQVKILGHRVELGEIERVLRSALDSELVAALAWPREGASAAGITAFVCGAGRAVDHALAACERALPPYMVPREIRELNRFPLNANGKIDRGALMKILEEQCK